MNEDTQDKIRREQCLRNGVNPYHHCCLKMAYYISRPVEREHQGANRVLDWVEMWDEYRIPVSYDGYVSTLIAFCPWCGAKLPESKRRRWYETLNKLGYNDPSEQDIPEEFNSDVWWRRDGI